MNTGKSNVTQIIIIVGILLLALIGVLLVPNTVLSLDGMLAKGEMYQKTGRTALALKIFQKATEDYPASYEAHLLLGNVYREVDQPDKAREEFDKAVELSGNSKDKFNAQIAMSTMLLADGNFEKAETLLLSVEDPKPDKVKEKLAELYVQWGDKKFAENNRQEAIDKYELAFKNYDSVDVEAQQIVEEKVIKTYMDIANYYLTNKKIDQAVSTLNQSIDFVDNPSAHIKLAELFKKQNKRDESIAEYEKAYNLDTTGTAALYLGELLVEKGVELAKDNQMDKAKECFEKAQETNPSIIIPAEILYSISIEDIKVSVTPNTVADKLFPKVSFVVKNQGKDNIDFLKVQAVFLDQGEILSRTEETVIKKNNPLPAKSKSNTVSMTSPVGVEGLKKPHILQAKIYLVYGENSDWKFARTITLTKQKDIFTVKKTAPASSDNTAKKPALTTSRVPSVNDPKNEHQQTTSFLPDKVAAKETPQANTTINSPIPQPMPIPVQVKPNNSNVELPPLGGQ